MSQTEKFLRVNKHHICEDKTLHLEGVVSAAELDLPLSPREHAYSPVGLSLDLSMANDEQMVVRGKAALRVRLGCDRCLVEFDHDMQVGDICHVIDKCPDFVDLTEGVREDILISLPELYLCSEDCRGLCSGCGVDLNRQACSCAPSAGTGPLAAALDSLDLGEILSQSDKKKKSK